MLRVDDIHVYRGRTYVLRGISLEVHHGEIVALIGANGAGKTSTLRTISGLLKPQKGHIFFRQATDAEPMDISRLAPEEIVRLGICHCPEGRGIFSQLSVRETCCWEPICAATELGLPPIMIGSADCSRSWVNAIISRPEAFQAENRRCWQ
jgi:ABC-type branched-subunit amino acid transport system ATPase component